MKSRLSKKSWFNIPIIFRLLAKTNRRKLVQIIIIQTALGVLDLVGVILIGALGALSVRGIESNLPGNRVKILLQILHLSNLSFHSQVATIGLLAATLLLAKTIISAYFTRKTLFFLSRRSAETSAELVSKYLSQDLIAIQKTKSQDLIYIVSDGVKNLFVGVLASAMALIVDSSMLLMLGVGLFFADPVMAMSTILLFVTVGFILHKLLSVRATEIGGKVNALTVESAQKLLEALNSFRETTVRNRRQFYSQQFRDIRYKFGSTIAEQDFQPYISKYVIEATSVFGALILSGYEFGLKNAVQAVSILAIFLAASSRIAPAALRIQQGVIMIKNSLGASKGTLALIETLQNFELDWEDTSTPTFEYNGFVNEINLRNVSFKYYSDSMFEITNANLKIEAGSSIAIVGPSGAGKTSLADLILGILQPSRGDVRISGLAPARVVERWPGAISYVPQNIMIAGGTIRENVGQGYPREVQTDDGIWEALRIAQLESVVNDLKDGLDENLGENGSKLSGGQRQRLGIARALFTSPKVLCLDEATSALDGETESKLNDAILQLSGEVTVVIIAHRLATVRLVDQIAYMEKGRILAVGTFEEVRAKIPNFDKQAKLMGL
jgi:ABC-type multidrug transport system fused ATPase/permease subunit